MWANWSQTCLQHFLSQDETPLLLGCLTMLHHRRTIAFSPCFASNPPLLSVSREGTFFGWTHASCGGSVESYPLDLQEIPSSASIESGSAFCPLLLCLGKYYLKFLAFPSHPSHTYAVVWFQGDSFALFVDRWCFSKTFGDSELGGVIQSSQVVVAQLCLTFCDPVGCSPPDSSVHGILQTRILEWVAIPFS